MGIETALPFLVSGAQTGIQAISASNAAQAQSDANATNEQLFHESQTYNAEQAGISRAFSADQANQARLYNADQAAQSRVFVSQLANTAHQREVADLKAAGLNPILSGLGGGGAQVPSGATASISPVSGASASSPSAPSIQPVVNQMGKAVDAAISNNSALQAIRQSEAQTDNILSQNKLNQALALKAGADANTALSVQRNYDADTQVKKTGYAGKFLGSDAATKGSDLANNAASDISEQIKSLISNVTDNSAKKVSFPPPFLDELQRRGYITDK